MKPHNYYNHQSRSASPVIALWGGPWDGGAVPEEEAEVCGKFVMRSTYRTIQENGILVPHASHCYAVYGRTSKYNYQFVGYGYEEKVKEMLDA